ncbi:beta-lactamase/transpeptidase-like protein [Xylaria sp. FL0933]|nr:beta-lactamase/transpeptidase-like protein [Xylaria sp. FL0933]
MGKQLDEILQAHVVTPSETGVKDKLLAAGFVLVDKDGVLYTGTAGRLDFDPSSPAYTADSISWLASMTKLVTAVSLLQLIEKVVIGLDDDVRDALPELAALPVLREWEDDGAPILEAHGRVITLRHLLTHTLGIGIDMADPDLLQWSNTTSRRTNYMSYTLEGIKTPLKFAPGEGWYYGTAYDWAGHLLTKLTRTSLSSYMQAHIFDSLSMTSTTFHPISVSISTTTSTSTSTSPSPSPSPSPSDTHARHLAYAYSTTNPKTSSITLHPGPSPSPSPMPSHIAFKAGGSGLFSTPGDFARLLHGILSGKLLKPETTELLFTPQLNDAQRGIMIGIAAYAREMGFAPEFPLDHSLAGVLNMQDVPGKRRAGSLMWSGATNGRWWIDRETGIAGAVFTQVEPHGNAIVVDMFDKLERTVYQGQPYRS